MQFLFLLLFCCYITISVFHVLKKSIVVIEITGTFSIDFIMCLAWSNAKYTLPIQYTQLHSPGLHMGQVKDWLIGRKVTIYEYIKFHMLPKNVKKRRKQWSFSHYSGELNGIYKLEKCIEEEGPYAHVRWRRKANGEHSHNNFLLVFLWFWPLFCFSI